MRLFWLLGVGLALVPAPQACSADKVAEVQGILLAKSKDGWSAVKKGDAAPQGVPIVALPEAAITAESGATLRLKADIGKRGPLPVLESAIVLHASKDHDIDFTLERGIVVLGNPRKEGDVKISVRLRGSSWSVTLRPESALGIELYARYAPGVLKEFTGKLEDSCAQVIGLMLQGRAFLNTGEEGFGLQAPPGAAIFHWDNLERKLHVDRLEKLPDFIRPMTAEEKKVCDQCALASDTLSAADKSKALASLIQSDSHVARISGVVMAGAIDDVAVLFAALEDEKHRDVREQAILVLRHYLGRGPEQVGNAFRYLTEKKATPVQAGLFLELLLGFTKDQLHEPATYDVLIRLMDHPRLGVRELAHWHLVRLVPLERPIAFDPAAPAAERQKAVQQWRDLIPAGELPPHLREKK